MVQPILDGRVKAGKPANLDGFDLAPYVKISMGTDLAACRDALQCLLRVAFLSPPYTLTLRAQER